MTSHKRLILNHRGLSLIEILVAVALITVLVGVFTAMVNNVYSALRHTDHKFEIQETEKLIASAFKSGNVCTWQMTSHTLDVSATPDASGVIPSAIVDLTELYITEATGGPAPAPYTPVGPPIAKVGEKLQGTMSNLQVDGIRLAQVRKLGAASDLYQGVFEIQLRDANSTFAYRPMQVKQIIKVDPTSGTPDARPIIECLASAKEIETTYLVHPYYIDMNGRCRGTAFQDLSRPVATNRPAAAVSYAGAFASPHNVPAEAKEVLVETLAIIYEGLAHTEFQISPGPALLLAGYAHAPLPNTVSSTITMIWVPINPARTLSYSTQLRPPPPPPAPPLPPLSDPANQDYDCIIIKVMGYR